jgi:hypothetical protein
MPHTMKHQTLCCSIVFIGTNRMFGRVTASQVAAFCYLRTQAGLLALRDRPIMLGQTEVVTRRST